MVRVVKMPKIVKPPKPKRVECEACGATLEYLPEEVEEYHGKDISGGADGYERVKCPREGCIKGYGYIRSW